MIFAYEASTIDSVTESLMMKAAATPAPPSGENILQQAMRVYILNNADVQSRYGIRFYEYEWLGSNYTAGSYERYWHGYLVFLKLLLYLFTMQDIIFLNSVCQGLCILAILWALRRNGIGELQFPFLVLWIVTMQIVVMYSLDYSACFYVYALTVLLLLLSERARKKSVCFSCCGYVYILFIFFNMASDNAWYSISGIVIYGAG